MMRPTRFVAAALLLVALVGCKPDEQTEKSRFGANLAAVHRIETHYPATQKVLEQRVAEAKRAWDKAIVISDKEKRAAAMQAVNNSVSQLTGAIERVEDKIKKVDRYHRDTNLSRKVPGNLWMPALFRADRAVREAKEELRHGPFRSAEELLHRAEDANDMMISALRPIEKLERLSKEKKK